MTTTTPHNYVTKILRLKRVGALPLDVGVHQLDVAHDDWCGIFQGQRCHCDPDITLPRVRPASRNRGGGRLSTTESRPLPPLSTEASSPLRGTFMKGVKENFDYERERQ